MREPVTAERINSSEFPRLKRITGLGRPRVTAKKRIAFIQQQFTKTDSDMFEYYAGLEIEKLTNFVNKYSKTNH